MAASPLVRPWVASRAFILGSSVVGCLLVFLTVFLTVVQFTLFSPGAAVRTYMGALADRNYAKASAQLSGSENMEQALAMTAAAGGYLPPNRVRYQANGENNPGQRSGEVSYEIDGKPYSSTVGLSEASDKSFGVFRDWNLDGGLGYLVVNGGSMAGVAVNGVALGDEIEGVLSVFPGRYTVTAESTALLTTEPVNVAVPIGAETTATLTPSLVAGADRLVSKVINKYVDDCRDATLGVTGGATEPCDLFSSSYNSTSIKVERYPEISLEIEDGYVSVKTVTPGSALVRSEYSADESVELTVTGYAGTTADNQIVFQSN